MTIYTERKLFQTAERVARFYLTECQSGRKSNRLLRVLEELSISQDLFDAMHSRYAMNSWFSVMPSQGNDPDMEVITMQQPGIARFSEPPLTWLSRNMNWIAAVSAVAALIAAITGIIAVSK